MSRHALTLPADASAPLHRAWVAFEDAIAGDHLLPPSGTWTCSDGLDGEPLQIASMARAVVRLQRARRRDRPGCSRPRATIAAAAPAGAPRLWRDPP